VTDPWDRLRRGARSVGTSDGMRRYYLRIPRCRSCRKVHLVRWEARATGLCAKCRRANLRKAKP